MSNSELSARGVAKDSEIDEKYDKDAIFHVL
jgi:hypothetical protein